MYCVGRQFEREGRYNYLPQVKVFLSGPRVSLFYCQSLTAVTRGSKTMPSRRLCIAPSRYGMMRGCRQRPPKVDCQSLRASNAATIGLQSVTKMSAE